MNKRKPYAKLILFIFIVIAFAVGAYFLHPIGPVLVAALILVQLPMIIKIIKAAFGESYVERAQRRRKEYEAGALSAADWLDAETAETKTTGFESWSAAGKSLNTLNRSDILFVLGKNEEAKQLLDRVEKERLAGIDLERYEKLMQDFE